MPTEGGERTPEEQDFAARAANAEKEIASIFENYKVRVGAQVVYTPDGIHAKVVFVDQKPKEETK